MQQQQINLNPDLVRLQKDGYDIEVNGGYLVVRQIPYVNPQTQINYGILICVLNYISPTVISPPPDHTIYFCGEIPCNSEGQPLNSIINNSQSQQLTDQLVAQHYLSSKPVGGNYPGYHEKIRTYAEIISIHAKAIDKNVTTKPLNQ